MKMGMIPARKIFGADISGTVETAGRNVKLFKPGDEVAGDLAGYGFGGFAGFAVSSEKFLVPKPAGLSFEEAAAMPMASVTALHALRNKGNIRAGQEILILGSSGGVGTFALQLARHYGAVVTAVCSTRNVEQTALLGAEHVIDYTKEDFAARKRKYDLILAVNGIIPFSSAESAEARWQIRAGGGALTQIFKSIVLGRPLLAGEKCSFWLRNPIPAILSIY